MANNDERNMRAKLYRASEVWNKYCKLTGKDCSFRDLYDPKENLQTYLTKVEQLLAKHGLTLN